MKYGIITLGIGMITACGVEGYVGDGYLECGEGTVLRENTCVGEEAEGTSNSRPTSNDAEKPNSGPTLEIACDDGVQNGDESGIDCGGNCEECSISSCTDGIQNGDESRVDCGGSCAFCVPDDWTCESSYFNDGECDCGCGAYDSQSDCVNYARESCSFNNCTNGAFPDSNNTSACVAPPSAPSNWSCHPDDYADGVCDCGCGIQDSDCATSTPEACGNNIHCSFPLILGQDDNSICVGPPASSIQNPSFELQPIEAGSAPGWILDAVGSRQFAVVGPGQTAADHGSRAMKISTSDGQFIGIGTILSSPFIPPSGSCVIKIAIGDANVGIDNLDFGEISIQAPDLPSPLNTADIVFLGTRAGDDIAPPTDGYIDVELNIVTDGSTAFQVKVESGANFLSIDYYIDNTRITCDE